MRLVDPGTAPIGCRVPTLDGEKILKVRAGTQSGDRLRLRGLGMTVLGTSQRGDQFIVLKCAADHIHLTLV